MMKSKKRTMMMKMRKTMKMRVSRRTTVTAVLTWLEGKATSRQALRKKMRRKTRMMRWGT